MTTDSITATPEIEPVTVSVDSTDSTGIDTTSKITEMPDITKTKVSTMTRASVFDEEEVILMAEALGEETGYRASAIAEYKNGKLTVLVTDKDEAVVYQADANEDLMAEMEMHLEQYEARYPADDYSNRWNAIIAALEPHRLMSVEQFSQK